MDRQMQCGLFGERWPFSDSTDPRMMNRAPPTAHAAFNTRIHYDHRVCIRACFSEAVGGATKPEGTSSIDAGSFLLHAR